MKRYSFIKAVKRNVPIPAVIDPRNSNEIPVNQAMQFSLPPPLIYKIPFPTAAKVLCKGRDGNFRLSDCLGQVKLHGVGHVKPSG